MINLEVKIKLAIDERQFDIAIIEEVQGSKLVLFECDIKSFLSELDDILIALDIFLGFLECDEVVSDLSLGIFLELDQGFLGG